MTGRIAAEIDRRVSAQEIRDALERPLTPDEREEGLALVRWFTRRYPTGADRLAYVRRAYQRWTAASDRRR
jgi:hypothetical protein